MLTLPSMHDECIGVVISPQTLLCSWLQPYKPGYPSILKACAVTQLGDGVVNADRIFSPTLLAKHIRSFIAAYGITRSYVLFAVDSPGMYTEFLRFSSHHNLHSIKPPRSTIGYSYYLYPDGEQAVFLYAGMPCTLLAQYVFLAMSINLNLVAIVPHFMAYLALYKHLYGTAFRRAQLACDMQKHNNRLEDFFAYDDMKRLVYTGAIPYAFDHNVQLLALVTGLHIMGTSYEKD